MPVTENIFWYRLNARYEERPLPQVSIVDLREELKKGNRSVLSMELKQQMDHALKNREQVMLFLNRRGYAGFVSCRACGHVMKCPHCDVSLSEHNGNRLVCITADMKLRTGILSFLWFSAYRWI